MRQKRNAQYLNDDEVSLTTAWEGTRTCTGDPSGSENAGVPSETDTSSTNPGDSTDYCNLRGQHAKHDEGYDSDGRKGPFLQAIFDEGDQYEEHGEDYRFGEDTVVAARDETGAEDEDEDKDKDVEEEDLEQRSTLWLKHELKLRCQPTSGKKKDLVERLMKAMDRKTKRFATLKEIPPAKRPRRGRPTTTRTTQATMSLFPETVFWRELHPKAAAVVEDTRVPTTVPNEGEVLEPPTKHNFVETFDIPEFRGTKVEYKVDEKGKICKDEDGEPFAKSTRREKGCIDPKFKKKHKLSAASPAWKYAEVFLPLNHNADQKDSFSFESMTKWTNTKARIFTTRDTNFSDFVPFETAELRQFFGLHVLHALGPAGCVEDKLRSTRDDRLCGNDFIHNNLIGRSVHKINPQKRYEHFKTFLACQNPHLANPSRKQYPNWKVRPLIEWMNHRCPQAWMLGRQITVDEMAMQFRGHHHDTRASTDGFQADALCDDGYCYQVYMRNDPAPGEYRNMKLSPLDARIMALFDALEDEHHHVGIDSVYKSVLFCKAAYLHKNRVLCHGAARRKKCGIPDCVLQQNAENREEGKHRGAAAKAAVLEGDTGCGFLVASSVCDAKPVHYLSMATSRIEWIEKVKTVYDVVTDEEVEIKFLGLNQLDTNNHSMGDVEIVDQSRFVFPLERFVRNRKWWWSTMFRAVGVLLTNAYKLYSSVCRDEGVNPSYKTHYDFREAIGMYWIVPDDDVANFEVTLKDDKSDVSALTEDDESCNSVGITDNLLENDGPLRFRLDRSLDHIPCPPRPKARCAMHGWLGLKEQGHLMRCGTCNVHLCIDCYGTFHRSADLVSQKRMLQNEFIEERKRQKK